MNQSIYKIRAGRITEETALESITEAERNGPALAGPVLRCPSLRCFNSFAAVGTHDYLFVLLIIG